VISFNATVVRFCLLQFFVSSRETPAFQGIALPWSTTRDANLPILPPSIPSILFILSKKCSSLRLGAFA